mgnify:CR=1 FL=1
MRTLSLALLLAASLTVRADVVIEQKMESAMLNGNMTMKIKGTVEAWYRSPAAE